MCILLDHVAHHIAHNGTMPDARYGRQGYLCGFLVLLLGPTNRSASVQFQIQQGTAEETQRAKEVPGTHVFSPLTMNIRLHLRLLHPSPDSEILDVGAWIVEKQSAQYVQKTKTKKRKKLGGLPFV